MFRIVKILNGRVNVPEPVKMPASTSANYAFGDALKLSSGVLAQCAATDKPEYIAMESASGVSALLVAPVSSDMVFEVPVTAAPTSLKVGNKVTVGVVSSHADAVTATTTDGVVTVFDLNNAKAAGDFILCRVV